MSLYLSGPPLHPFKALCYELLVKEAVEEMNLMKIIK